MNDRACDSGGSTSACTMMYREMLNELEAHHREVLRAIDELEHQTSTDVPHKDALWQARLYIAKASIRRFNFLESQVYPALLKGCDHAEAAELDNFRGIGRALRDASTKHVARWSLDAIFKDWNGYRRASALVRASMRARVAAEVALLYPHLARLGTVASP